MGGAGANGGERGLSAAAVKGHSAVSLVVWVFALQLGRYRLRTLRPQQSGLHHLSCVAGWCGAMCLQVMQFDK
jgi:nitric oxide reductase large subunit